MSIGARALTGDDYHGHVFWDTEIYLLPFYVLTWPEAARALLTHRFCATPRRCAGEIGKDWVVRALNRQFADSGAETTPQQVIGADRRVIDILSGKGGAAH